MHITNRKSCAKKTQMRLWLQYIFMCKQWRPLMFRLINNNINAITNWRNTSQIIDNIHKYNIYIDLQGCCLKLGLMRVSDLVSDDDWCEDWRLYYYHHSHSRIFPLLYFHIISIVTFRPLDRWERIRVSGWLVGMSWRPTMWDVLTDGFRWVKIFIHIITQRMQNPKSKMFVSAPDTIYYGYRVRTIHSAWWCQRIICSSFAQYINAILTKYYLVGVLSDRYVL